MITVEDLIGKKQGQNEWGVMQYSKGLIETYLPGECDYHGDNNSEGRFLARLCLYLLDKTGKAASQFFDDADDLLFLEHFVFHNIPKNTFLDTISDAQTDTKKVQAICTLIHDTLLKGQTRFHDFYYNDYLYFKSCNDGDRSKKIIYCQYLFALYQQIKYHGISAWDDFCTACQRNNINIDKPIGLKALLEDYLINRENVRDAKGNTKEYFHCSLFAFFQKSFRQKRDAVVALSHALTGTPVDLTQHLATLRDGHLGRTLRSFIKSGQADELVGKEVRTIRAFVAALQEKNRLQQSSSLESTH